jgi:Flp pilus assembly protein TadB
MSESSKPAGTPEPKPHPRAAYAHPGMRISDAERAEVSDRLSQHYGDGRLDEAEFGRRLDQAMHAVTQADLNGLFDDLPEPGHGGPRDSQAPMAAQPHRRRHPVLLVVLAVVVVLAAAHALFAGPWLWLGLIVAAVLFVTRGTRHTRPRQDREGA